MRTFIFLFLFFLFPFSVGAEPTTVERVENYLNSLTTVVTDFTQTAPDGTLANGKFYLERPGKMRWEYEPPVPILMVSSGGVMTYFDRELAQTSTIPIDNTPAGILVREHIAFSGDIAVKEMNNEAGIIHITLIQPEKMDNGELTLELTAKPLALKNLSFIDATKQETRIRFSNAVMGQPIDSKLFTLRK
jgi:outer membrane lipoprotein-sorting protein